MQVDGHGFSKEWTRKGAALGRGDRLKTVPGWRGCGQFCRLMPLRAGGWSAWAVGAAVVGSGVQGDGPEGVFAGLVKEGYAGVMLRVVLHGLLQQQLQSSW